MPNSTILLEVVLFSRFPTFMELIKEVSSSFLFNELKDYFQDDTKIELDPSITHAAMWDVLQYVYTGRFIR